MPIPVDAKDRDQYLIQLSNGLAQTDLLAGKPIEIDPTKAFHTLISAAGKRRLDILETAAILVPPRKWHLGITTELLNVMPLSQQFLSIHLKPRVYYSGADASITFQQEREGKKVVERAHFQSPHLGRGRLGRASEDIWLPVTSRQHQKVEGVEFYLDRGDLVWDREDGWGQIITTFQFNERERFVEKDEIFQTYTPTEKDQSGPSKIEVKLDNPYSEEVELRCIVYTTVDGVEGTGTLVNKYRLDDGRLTDSSKSFWGKIAREKMHPGTNVRVFTNQGVEKMQAMTASIPSEIDIGRLYRNLAQGEFAFAGMWTPQMGDKPASAT